MQFVDYAEMDYIKYMGDLDELQWGENGEPLTDLCEGNLYVTVDDDLPWLQINIAPGYGLALKPALALYWLDEVQKFYERKNNTLSETKIDGDE